MITFRPLEADDFELLHRWLNEPGVVEWWEGDDVSADAVRRHYFTEVEDGVEHWLAQEDGVPFGWIQCYPAISDPDECGAWLALGVPDSAAGIDYLIGEASLRGAGRGAAMIDRFVVDVVFGRHDHWTHAAAGPFSANERSWGALARAGFTHVGTIDDPHGPLHLMVRSRNGVPDLDPRD